MPTRNFEKRRSIFSVFVICVVLLMVSSFFLRKATTNTLIPQSVMTLVFANNTSPPMLITDENANSNQGMYTSRSVSPVLLDTGKIQGIGNGAATHAVSGDLIRFKRRRPCGSDDALLRVYMYDLPPIFHFGLLGWKGRAKQTWPDVSKMRNIPPYPGGLNLQHSVEYWLTLDLLSSSSDPARPCTAVRVMNSSSADVIFVPFFSSLSYNRYSKVHGKEKVSKNRYLQDELVKFLMNREEWNRSRGKDHLILAHHPNSMLDARWRLGPAIFVLADFGRYTVGIANTKKDVIAPYRHVVRSVGSRSPPFKSRPILMYFQGAIYRKDGGAIRQELYYLLKDEKDVHFSFGAANAHGMNSAGRGMASSKFCLSIAGDTPSSNRLFDAIASHCVPVIISDEIELPFEDVLDYTEFCIFVQGSNAIKKGFLVDLLRRISEEEWTKMWKRLKQVSHHFEYQYPSQQGDAVQMIWEAIARKLSSVRLALHKENRFLRSSHNKQFSSSRNG